MEEITATLQLLFSISDHFPAEVLDGIVEVFPSEDNSRTRGKCLHLCASIAKLSQKLLHKSQLDHHIKMFLHVDSIVERRCKLLERMDSHLNLWLRQSEAPRQGCILSIDSLDSCPCDMLLNLV